MAPKIKTDDTGSSAVSGGTLVHTKVLPGDRGFEVTVHRPNRRLERVHVADADDLFDELCLWLHEDTANEMANHAQAVQGI